MHIGVLVVGSFEALTLPPSQQASMTWLVPMDSLGFLVSDGASIFTRFKTNLR